MRKLVPALVLLLVASGVVASAAGAKSVSLAATLSGEAEAPEAGAPNGKGRATFTLNDRRRREVCWRFRGLSGLRGKPLVSHIHKGPRGRAGDVVIPLGDSFRARGCVSARRSLVRAIMARPGRYYVNVHNERYPAGAVRGQLRKRQAVTTLRGTVGGGSDGNAFRITLERNGNRVRSLEPGRYRLVIRDLSSIHNFHLTGPGVNRRTSVGAEGTRTWTLRLREGRYTFVCDPHAGSMRGSFRVA